MEEYAVDKIDILHPLANQIQVLTTLRKKAYENVRKEERLAASIYSFPRIFSIIINTKSIFLTIY